MILGYLPIVLIFIMFMAHAFGVNGVIHVITGEVSLKVRKSYYNTKGCFQYIGGFKNLSYITIKLYFTLLVFSSGLKLHDLVYNIQ